MPTESWYDVFDGETLLQGDLLFHCPARLENEWNWPIADVEISAEIIFADLIILTQSCDLQHDRMSQILLAQIVPWSRIVQEELARGNTAIKSREFRKKLIEGSIPGLSLLHKNETRPVLEWSVVNFRRLYTLPSLFLQSFANSLGPRLRLRSPYREHLAQAFARYFMRVGLPHDAKAFEKEGDVQIP